MWTFLWWVAFLLNLLCVGVNFGNSLNIDNPIWYISLALVFFNGYWVVRLFIDREDWFNLD